MDANRKGQSELARMIWTVCTPIIFTIGIVGNALTIIVLNRRASRSSTTVYLTTLAIVDFLYILVGMPRWWIIYNFEYDIRHSNTFVCKVHWYVLYFTGAASTLLLVVLTCERILSTARPYMVRTYCSVRRSVLIATVLIIFVCAINSHVLFGFDLQEVPLAKPIDAHETNTSVDEIQHNSTMSEEVKIWSCTWTHRAYYKIFYEQYFLVVIFVIQYVTPMVFCMTGGLFIVWKLVKNNRLRKEMNRNNRSFESRTSRVTTMLLTINISYVILETPIQVFMTGRPYWMGAELTPVQEIVWAVISMMNYFNRAVNFILYFLSGTRFRKSFFEFITCKRSRPRYVSDIARVSMQEDSNNYLYTEESSVITSPI